eukprot:m.358311 g.358311  ORF g.358311 m.358311 type:complete len:52 (-) comp18110_c0_seq1:72-227(-)
MEKVRHKKYTEGAKPGHTKLHCTTPTPVLSCAAAHMSHCHSLISDHKDNDA